MKTTIPWIIALAAIIFAGITCERQVATSSIDGKNLKALNDTVRTWKDKYGRNVAEKKSFEAFSKKQFINIKNLEGTNLRLQNTVDNLRGTIAAISHDVVTEYIINSDSVEILRYVDNFPVYQSQYKDEWIDALVTMGKDSLQIDQRILNKFDYAITRSKNLFKPDTLFIRTTSLNPNTYTSDLSSFTYTAKPKRISIGPSISYGFNGNSLGLNIGVSVQYSVIEF
ncbi:MAG: hypothetical protein ACI9DM_002201 [Cyclobacteriaceae bacterium]|jgi:hypothetical protein